MFIVYANVITIKPFHESLCERVACHNLCVYMMLLSKQCVPFGNDDRQLLMYLTGFLVLAARTDKHAPQTLVCHCECIQYTWYVYINTFWQCALVDMLRLVVLTANPFGSAALPSLARRGLHLMLAHTHTYLRSWFLDGRKKGWNDCRADDGLLSTSFCCHYKFALLIFIWRLLK